MTIRHFCTYLDSRYLNRGLALIESLRQHCRGFHIWVLCFDAASHAALRELGGSDVSPIPLDEFEHADAGLAQAKPNRSLVEYYFTCTPALALFVLRHNAHVDLLTYLDADVFLFDNPEPLFEEMGQRSIAIIPHRFPQAMRKWEACGIYNVGWLTFRRDANALACLTWWRDRCLEWCYDRVEPGRFADQKYLDDWPTRFSGVHVIGHRGANVASWNLAGHRITKPEARVLVDGQPLIFFHFHHLKQRASWLFETDFHVHGARPTRIVKRDILAPYLKTLDAHARVAITRDATIKGSLAIREGLRADGPIRIRKLLHDVAAGKSLLYLNGRVC